MSDPIKFYVIPKCGLRVQVINENGEIQDPHPSFSNRFMYENPSILPLMRKKDKELVENFGAMHNFLGWMSPVNGVTLPRKIKERAGIPAEAVKYSYVYPQPHIAAEIDWDNLTLTAKAKTTNRDQWSNESDNNNNETNIDGALCAVLLGGFVYFDKHDRFLCLNALSLTESKYELRFAGPYPVSGAVVRELHRFERLHSVALGVLHEIGYVRCGWVTPGEIFVNRPLCDQDHRHHHRCNDHGAFVFCREDGTAIAQTLVKTDFIDPQSPYTYFREALQLAGCYMKQKATVQNNDSTNNKDHDQNINHNEEEEDLFFQSQSYGPKRPPHASSLHKSLNIITYFEESSLRRSSVNPWAMTKEKIQAKLIQQQTNQEAKQKQSASLLILHNAIKRKTSKDQLSILLEKHGRMIRVTDHKGWLPLHYACFFHPDVEIVGMLLQKYSLAMEKPDSFNRYPLHIALDANAPEEVIDLLIPSSNKRKQWILSEATMHLKLLPLHIACMRSSSKQTIEKLLPTDADGKPLSSSNNTTSNVTLLSQKTAGGSLPLHLALLTKKPPAVVQLLANEYVIKQPYAGMFPLQIACRNNSCNATMKFLLKYDNSSNYVLKEVSRSSVHQNAGMVALQLAVQNNSSLDVIQLLLEHTSYGADSVRHRDINDCCALHYACQRKGTSSSGGSSNSNKELIELLLYLDYTKETTQYADKKGLMPLHYLCMNLNSASLEQNNSQVGALLEAEQQYIRLSGSTIRSTHQEDCYGRNPLSLALIAGASSSDIEILLRPTNFNLNQKIDNNLAHKLAKHVCADPKSQGHIINHMSDRAYFCTMILEVLTHFFIVYSFFSASHAFFLNNDYYHHCSSRLLLVPVIMSFTCSIILLMLQLFQLDSQGLNYLQHVSSMVNWLLIGFLVASLILIITNCDYDDHNAKSSYNVTILFSVTALLAIFGFIRALRYAFLPFARFIVGTTKVLTQIVPFLVVSALFIVWFAYMMLLVAKQEESLGKDDYLCITIIDCAYRTFDGFVDHNETEDAIGVLVGIVMTLVLLNVLIAVVCEVWDEAVDSANLMFWSYRIDIITQSRSIKRVMFSETLSYLLTKYIDSFTCPQFHDTITWSETPYSLVKNYEMYKTPHDYFIPKVADSIVKAHSLSADMHWINNNDDSVFKQTSERSIYERSLLWIGSENVKACLLWILRLNAYTFLIFLGLCTFGFLWPKDFRTFLLSYGTQTHVHSQSQSHSQGPKQLYKKRSLSASASASQEGHLLQKSRSAYEASLLAYQRLLRYYPQPQQPPSLDSSPPSEDYSVIIAEYNQLLANYESIYGQKFPHQVRLKKE